MWGCKKHWCMVPRPIRVAILHYYRPGQENDWQPSEAYLKSARQAVIALAKIEGVEPDTSVYDMFVERAS